MSTRPIPTPFDAPLPGEPGAQPSAPMKQVATPFDTPLPGEVADPNQSATAQQMQAQGVSNYKPGQGLPFGHYGMGMTTGDVTPEQAKSGALTIGGVTLGAAAPAIASAGARALIPYATQIVKGAKFVRDAGLTLSALKYLSHGDLLNFIKKSPGK